MSTKPVADPDIEPEYDFRASVPNPYAERYREGRAPLVSRSGESPGSATRSRSILLEYDEAVDAAYLILSDAPWDHQVRLDDARAINYAADGSVIGIEILSPRRHGVRLAGLPYPDDVTRVLRSVGFRILDRPRERSATR